jgi:hypothetical protein
MLTIIFLVGINTLKTKLIELELMKQLLHKKLAKIENEINQLLKGENTYEQELKGTVLSNKQRECERYSIGRT